MRKIIDQIVFDVQYIKHHKLQPGWFKILKVFILIGIVAAYVVFFGWVKTVIFTGAFLLSSLIIHYIYRFKTKRFTTSWLDFHVREENGLVTTDRIGIFYYLAIITNALIAFLITQLILAGK